MAYEFIVVEKRGRLTVVTINRPAVMNTMHLSACQELDEAFNDFSEDPGAWAAIITGAGERAFCAGNDLKWQAKHGVEVFEKGLKSLKGGYGGITLRFDCFKPVIAAVNGFALGGGFEIVMACDIVIAVESATFGLPEPRVGLMAKAGGVHRLPRQMPYHLAMGFMLTGRQMTAQQAHQLGIVNEVVSRAELMPAAERWAMEILECAPLAVRASKEATLQGFSLSLEKAISTTFPGMVTMMESEDYVEGPRAFSEKRKPQWKGK
jgi:enoyl-CoA hydratase/carnithine racemase